MSLMKKDQAIKAIGSVLEDIKYDNSVDKHSSVNCTFVVVYKMKSKTMKFMQNFAVEIPSSFSCDSKPLVYCDSDTFQELNKKFENRIIDGTTLEVKKIKRNFRWALVKNEFGIEKWKTTLNKKALLPNNLTYFENISLEEQIEKVISGNLIKVTQMNNFFSFKIGSLDKNSQEDILKNIEAVYDFVNIKLGYLIGRVYINKNMEKSNKICVRF